MKKVSFVGTVRYLGAILIVMQGVLLTMLAIILLNSQYQKQWEKYPENGQCLTVYLNNTPEEYRSKIEDYFYTESEKKDLFIVRCYCQPKLALF